MGYVLCQMTTRSTERETLPRDDLCATSSPRPSCDWGPWELREWLIFHTPVEKTNRTTIENNCSIVFHRWHTPEAVSMHTPLWRYNFRARCSVTFFFSVFDQGGIHCWEPASEQLSHDREALFSRSPAEELWLWLRLLYPKQPKHLRTHLPVPSALWKPGWVTSIGRIAPSTRSISVLRRHWSETAHF